MEKVLRRNRIYCLAFVILAFYAALTSTIEHSQLALVGQIIQKRIRERILTGTYFTGLDHTNWLQID